MEIITFDISGLKLIKPKKFSDARGFFTERYNQKTYSENNLPINFIQDNFSRSLPKVLRGLHFQEQNPQGKMVTCLSGCIFDVAVDIRHNSATYGRHISVELNGEDPSWFWIPSGFAHGFCVLGNQPADVMYKVDNYYDPKSESGILWNDPELGIVWPLKDPLLSDKDKILQNFLNYQKKPSF